MNTAELRDYIQQRLADLKKEKDMADVVHKGRLSLGLNTKEYKHLPSWKELLKAKKKLISMFWLGCFFTSFIVVGMTYDLPEKFQENWVKAIVTWTATSSIAMVVYVMTSYFSLFYQVRKTEHEARKLIYEDILEKIANEEPSGA